jgi:hypothetical protein
MEDYVDILFENDAVKLVRSYNSKSDEMFASEELMSEIENYYSNDDRYFVINKQDEEDFDPGDSDEKYNPVFLIVKTKYRIYILNHMADEVELVDILYLFPELSEQISKITGPNDLVSFLALVESGMEFDKWDIKDKYGIKNIDSIIYNQRRPGSGQVIIKFENTNEFFDIFDLNDDDKWYINQIFSDYGYSSDIFVDSYSMEQDFNEGYIFRGFNEENTDILNKIVLAINPMYRNWDEDVKVASKLAELFNSKFPRESDDITQAFSDNIESQCLEKAKKDIITDLCTGDTNNTGNILDTHGRIRVYKDLCFYKYKSYVFYLKELLIENKKSTIKDLFKKLADDAGVSDFEFHEYRYNVDIGESYNAEVTEILEKIWEKIEENPEEYIIDPIMLKILENYRVNQMNDLPGDRGQFKIQKIDSESKKIVVTHYKKDYSMEKKSFTPEEFFTFVSTGELFERKIWKKRKF